MSVTIYHNPRCTKSRAALKLLQDRGLELTIVDYFKTPLTESELMRLLTLLNMAPRTLLRHKEPEYLQAGLDNPDVSDDQIIRTMIKFPKLIERPIVVAGNRAVLGRPPENVLRII